MDISAPYTDQPLPRYEDLQNAQDVYYGVEIALNPQGRLFLQCDKYRDYFALDWRPSGTVEVIHYSHDAGPAQVIGSIAPNRFMLIKSNKVRVTVESTFTMRNTNGPLCAYSSFTYQGQNYLWRVKYDPVSSQERVKYCCLLKNEKHVASFVTGQIDFGSGFVSLGNLFLRCFPAQWPVTCGKRDEKIFSFIGWHEKDPEADMMLVSFIAVWLKVLKQSLHRTTSTITFG